MWRTCCHESDVVDGVLDAAKQLVKLGIRVNGDGGLERAGAGGLQAGEGGRVQEGGVGDGRS